jgi:hypothetical protein
VFQNGDDSAVSLRPCAVEPVVSVVHCVGKIVRNAAEGSTAKIADEGSIGLKRKLLEEFEGLEDLDVKMSFKAVKTEKD